MTGPDERALREVADVVAMLDSGLTSALHAHRIITEHLWKALRILGFGSGRVLVHGDDPDTFLGLPHTTGYGRGSQTATVGPAHRPGHELRTNVLADDIAEHFDVVIAALPCNDVKLAQPAHQARRQDLHYALTLASLDLTKPGGLTVVLAPYDLLDAPDSLARQEIANQGDLVGAVRLPGGIQRNVAGTDAPTDLLLLHRVRDGERLRGIDFTAVTPIIVEGRQLRLNTYFDQRPDYILGEIGLDPTTRGSNTLTVTADPDLFEDNLSTALDDIATTARNAGVGYSCRGTTAGFRSQASEQFAASGASVNGPPASDPELENGGREPDWEDPDLGEPGLGLR